MDGYVVYRIDQKTQEYKEIGRYCVLGSSTTTDTFYFDYCKVIPQAKGINTIMINITGFDIGYVKGYYNSSFYL